MAPGNTSRSIADALAATAAYVPTEIIGLYTLTLGLAVSGESECIPFWGFWMFAVGAVLLTLLLFMNRCVTEKKRPERLGDWPLWEAASAVVGFTVWSMAIPKGAFEQYEWYTPTKAAIVLVSFSIVWPMLGAVVTSYRRR